MISVIRTVEWLTKTTLMGMFHIWYLWGCWLSWYITIDETNEDSPYSFNFDAKDTLHTRRKENKNISAHEEI